MIKNWITLKYGKILMEHIDLFWSLESKVFFVSICSIGIISRKLDILEKPLQLKTNITVVKCVCVCVSKDAFLSWSSVFVVFSYYPIKSVLFPHTTLPLLFSPLPARAPGRSGLRFTHHLSSLCVWVSECVENKREREKRKK